MCDSIFKRLHAKGIGTETKSTPVLSNHKEDKLWESGIINLDMLAGLLKAVFFYNSLFMRTRRTSQLKNFSTERENN